MGQPYVGEIRLFAGNFNPAGWMFCDGALLAISEYDVLYTLLGTTYGGDGIQTFGLPDLRGRVPVHSGQGGGLSPYVVGQKGGAENVTLISQQLPAHTHTMIVSGAGGTATTPLGNHLAAPGTISIYRPGNANEAFSPKALPTPAGGSQPHNNLQPLQAVNFIISLYGSFPSQN